MGASCSHQAKTPPAASSSSSSPGPPASASSTAGRTAYALRDGISGAYGVNVYMSFPGQHQTEWNFLVAMASLMRFLDPEHAFFSTTCIFLPPGDPLEGKHRDMPGTNECWCAKLYGEPQPWGCAWFKEWLDGGEVALDHGQKPIVVYKKGQRGEGDTEDWDNFPIQFSTKRRGLGGSQAGEVAWLRKRLRERGLGDDFKKQDADEAAEAISRDMFDKMKHLVQGKEGAKRVLDAINEREEIRGGLLTLNLDAVHIGRDGVSVLTPGLPKLTALRDLGLGGNNLGLAGALELAPTLEKMTGLRDLNFAVNNLGEAGAQALAPALERMGALQTLNLAFNSIGEAGARSLAPALEKMRALQTVYLGGNGLGEAGARALAPALEKLGALKYLYLKNNRLGDAGARALAPALEKMGALQRLNLDGNGIGEAQKHELKELFRQAHGRGISI